MYIRIVYTEIKSLDYKRMQLINIKLFHYNWNDNLLLITRGISGFYYQIVQQIKSRIQEMKEGSYTKTLTMFQVSTIFHSEILGEMLYLNLQNFVWRSHVGSPYRDTNMVAGTNSNNCIRVLQRKREFTSQGTHEQVILFLIQGLFKQQNTPIETKSLF